MPADKHPIDPSALAYRPCVGIMLINRAGLVWVGQRADMPGDAEGKGEWWQMPQGGLDAGEVPREGALRELYEETSVRSATLIGETADWLTYDLPPHLIGVAWGGKYRGQKQKWFAARFDGEDSEIDITAPPGHTPEFITWKWAPVSELVCLIVPFKRRVYEAVVAELGPLANVVP
ncbi:MAG: RNA pyrophosphohydrolase [Hyphomicrobium sp.]|jgi:putative (di)nucleoside polyphosphate hydrolase|nr:RNA pyrophosphohydrolase [Hyphomicrobium sp.]PPD07996.1 MAG: RNA pyrophosphohydrolase [Hyphomicrobium sp.]